MKYFPLTLALTALVFALTVSSLCAQVGNDNPTGQSGIFSGEVTTGCSYDPYTGNATRSITDIAVAGAVGEYPLALVRTANSRTPSLTGIFGADGGWNHNYNWTMDDSPVGYAQNFLPKKYTVNFPDGRVETFRAVTWDTLYRVRPGADTPAQSTSSGVRERLLQLNTSPNSQQYLYAYLILPDGGAVEFKAQQNYDPAFGRYWYRYHVTGIYDPHGLKTVIASEVVAQAQRRRITRVTEPAGRYLLFTYRTQTSPQFPRSRNSSTELDAGACSTSITWGICGWSPWSITAIMRGQQDINTPVRILAEKCRGYSGLAMTRCMPGQ
jgi:hypothetical protein